MKYVVVTILIAALVFAATPDDAKDAYLNATVNVEQVKRAGLPYQSLEDLLNEMEIALKGKNAGKLLETALILNQTEEGKERAQLYFAELDVARLQGLQPGQNFSFVVKNAQAIADKREQAFELHEQIEKLKKEVANETGINSSQVGVLLVQVKDAFEREDYDATPVLLNQTRASLDDAKVAAARERALARLARRNIQSFVQDQWLAVLVVLLVIVVVLFWGFVEGRVVYASKKICTLTGEVESAGESLLQAQKDYYSGESGRSTYNARIAAIREKQRTASAQANAWRELKKKYVRFAIISRFRIK